VEEPFSLPTGNKSNYYQHVHNAFLIMKFLRSEVGKGKVEVKPPDGMEFKKWDS